MPSQEHLYIITASNEDAKEHVRKSIANPIDPAIYAAHFPTDVLDNVRRKSIDGNFYAWGARPGKRNEPNWNVLQEGDYVFLYQDGVYNYWTRVISKHRNSGFAETVWGRHPEGELLDGACFQYPVDPARLAHLLDLGEVKLSGRICIVLRSTARSSSSSCHS